MRSFHDLRETTYMREMLKKRMAKRAQGQAGFTLIELLVVIAILAVLAGVVVFAVGGITDNGQDSACDIDERTLRDRRRGFRADEPTRAYPDRRWPTMVPGFLAERRARCTPTPGQVTRPAVAPSRRWHLDLISRVSSR